MSGEAVQTNVRHSQHTVIIPPVDEPALLVITTGDFPWLTSWTRY